MYRILSIEDNPDAEKVLKSHIERYAAEAGLAFSITWRTSAFDLAGGDETHFDLIFLDIELPGINGMEAAEAMREHDPETPIIFVTNLAQYAVHGYAVDALDFVVKPVAYYDFKLRMDKAMRKLDRTSQRSLSIPTESGFRVVAVADIAYVDVANHDLAYHLANGETLTVRGTLSKIETELEGTTFVRISNNCLANMVHIREIKGTDIHMANGGTIYFSRSRKKPALETIARYLGGSL